MDNDKIKNVIVNTHKNVRYIILANRKLTREEMLKQIRNYNYDTLHIRPKPGSEIELQFEEL